jgi:hypothetical protein
MKHLALFAALALSACASTTGTVALDADKAFLTADVAFKSAQQVVLAGIQSGTITGDTKAQVIAIMDKGAVAETAGFTAEQAANSVDEATAVTSLTTLLAQLSALGVLKAN